MLGSPVRFPIASLAVSSLGPFASFHPAPAGNGSVDRKRRSAQPAPPLRLPARRAGGVRTVRVLNWNLLHARKDNDTRLEIVARALEAEQPDLVALQEVSQSWFLRRPNRAEVLARRLGFAWKYRATNGAPKLWEEGLAVLARQPLVRTVRRRLDGSRPRPLNARQVLIGEARLEDGTPFSVASVHLSFPQGGEIENLEQALDAADLVSREALARGIPAVLVGDLNAPAAALSVRALTTGEILGGDAPFIDAWAAVGSGAGVTSTPSNPYTDAPADPPQRIDYVLVLQGTHPLATPVEARVIGDRPTEEGVYGSDHFGLVVDLELRSHPGTDGRSHEHDIAAAQDLCARIARVRSTIRSLRQEARAELERARRPLRCDQTGGCPATAAAQWLREATLARVRAAFGPSTHTPTRLALGAGTALSGLCPPP
jgi:endonuclease/exonuclease/phosphatase family metal-dependent hydrolase